MTHAVAFNDHASSDLAYDSTGQQHLQHLLLTSVIAQLPTKHLRSFATLLLDGHTPASAAAYMGQPAATGAQWWLDVQPTLADKLKRYASFGLA